MSAVAAPPRSPYKGLSAFDDTDLDALFFFGRERERDVIVANLLATGLTVLYGESGVGKSSVLRAGVVRELRRIAPDADVALHDSWSGSPGAAFAELADAGEAYLILDQFEEYFLYHGTADGPGTLLHDLPEVLRAGRVHVLISLREDALAQLDAFKARVPGIFANQLRLAQLDRAAATLGIVGPVERWNELTGEQIRVEPALVEAVLDEVEAAGEESLRHGRIEAPYLQLVLERVWDAERAGGSDVLRRATLADLGGAETIVREHVESALEALEADEQDVAAEMFEHLVTPSGTKIAHRAGDLAEYAAVPVDALSRVLAMLNRARILRTVDGTGAGGERYEIFHDVLAEPVLAWRSQRRLERERAEAARRQRRLRRLAIAALAGLLVVGAIAAFALKQWSAARSESRHARARAFEATALQQLDVEPERSMLLALDAARLEPGPASEAVLRRALIGARLRTVLSARGPVDALAYSPDGRRLAAASTDGRTRLYDVASGRRIGSIWHRGRAVAVSFSPDGSLVAAADDAGDVRVVAAATAKLLLVLHHGDAATSVTFDAAGRRLLTTSGDGTARIWRLPGGALVRTIRQRGPVALGRLGPRGTILTVAADRAGHVHAYVFNGRSGRRLRVFPEKGVSDLELSPDGRLVAVASQDGATRLHDVSSGRTIRVLDDGGGGIAAEAFSPDGTLLATAGDDGGVRVWRVADGSRYFFFTGHTQGVVAVAWSRRGDALADASRDGTSHLFAISGIEAGSVVATLAGHGDAVTAVAFDPSRAMLATASDDGTARLWDAQTDRTFALVGRGPRPVEGAALAPSGRLAVSVDGSSAARVWDVIGRRLVRVIRQAGAIADARFSPDGASIATASAGGTVALWSTATGRRTATLRLGVPLLLVRFSPDGRLVAAGATDGETAVWTIADGRRIAAVRRKGSVVGLDFDDAGALLVTSTRDGATVLDVARARVIRTLRIPGGVVRTALSPDGRLLATAGADDLGRLYDTHTGALAQLLRGHTEPLTDVVFSRGGHSVLTTSVDAHPRLWDVQTGRVEHVLVGHFGTVSTAAISPDGRWIVTAGPISAGVWPAATGRLLFGYLRGHTKLLTSVSFAADGRRILSSSLDGTVRVYDCAVCADLDALIELARVRLSRTAQLLTPEQRRRYLGG